MIADLAGVRVSNSRLGTFRRCQKKYEFKYIMGLEPKAKKVHLERGTWVHALLEEHYQGRDWKARHKAMSIEFYNLFEEIREELGDLPSECLRIMRSYLRYWKEEDRHFTVIDAELDEVVTLPSGLEFRMIIDLIIEDHRTGLLWPWDHKTRGNFEYGENMLIDPQLTNYFSGLQILGYEPLGGVCYNEISTKPPVVPKLTAKTKQLERRTNIHTDVYTYYKEIRRHGFDPNDYRVILAHIAKNEPDRFFRRVKLPKDKPMLRQMMAEAEQTGREIRDKEGPYVRTYDKRCKWDCDFKELCISQLHGGDIRSTIRHRYRKRKETDEVQEKK